jgi:hypothetical protein
LIIFFRKGEDVTYSRLLEKAGKYLHKLCIEIPGRRLGSKGNRLATDYFAEIISYFGFHTECPKFVCMDWKYNGAHPPFVAEQNPNRNHYPPDKDEPVQILYIDEKVEILSDPLLINSKS